MKRFIFLIIIFLSCSEKKNAYDNITYYQFPQEKKLIGKNLNNDNIIITYPKFKVSDSLCCFYGINQEGNLFSIYSYPKFEYKFSFGKNGRGPEEYFGTIDYDFIDNDIYIYHASFEKIFIYELNNDSVNLKNTIDLSFDRRYNYTNFKVINDSIFAFYRLISEDNAIIFFNNEGNQNDSLLYRPNVRKWPPELKGEVWSSLLSYNTKNNKLVSATVGGEVLDIITINNNEHHIAVGPHKKPTPKQLGNSYLSISIYGFNNLFLTDNYIYVLFSGLSVEDMIKEKITDINYNLYVYDYKGNPIRKYIIDDEIIAFHIDEKMNIMYATIEGEEYPLFSYDL